MGDSYSWTTIGSGDWNSISNWFDLTTGLAAGAVPGAADSATIDGPTTGTISIAGPASALDLTVNDNVTLTGGYSLDTFTIANPPFSPGFPPAPTTSDITLTGNVVTTMVTIGAVHGVPGFFIEVVNAGIVDIGAGATLSAGAVALAAGDVRADGGTMNISGILNLGTLLLVPGAPTPPVASGALDVSNHASVQVGDLVITDGSVSLDATSILEIGTAGTAAAGTITVDPGAELFVGSIVRSTATASIAGPVLNNGTFFTFFDQSNVVNNGSLEFAGTALGNSVNNGTITADSGTLTAIGGTGHIVVPSSITIGPDVEGTVDLHSSATLDIALGVGVPIDTGDTPPISGFANGGSIVLHGVNADSVHYTQTATAVGTLTLDSAGTSVASLILLGSYTDGQFALGTDSSGSTVTLPCFAAGTRILTRRGEVNVEHLRLDDEVVTLIGGPFRPVRWLGHRTVRTTGHPRAHAVLPVRIEANAFGAGLPRRPLLLSPDHAVFADGVLIPIKYLVNGQTISQVEARRVTYWHVELEVHDVVFAAGLPAESYLDTGDRAHFANGGAVTTLYPSFASLTWEAKGCAPLIVTGCILERVRRRLQRRASASRRSARRRFVPDIAWESDAAGSSERGRDDRANTGRHTGYAPK
ncbi:MAG TPA: Hint domain-containing protein [Acetobacteraceae bacterium]|jgi:hypothetical protein